jgi:hypothetical protein
MNVRAPWGRQVRHDADAQRGRRVADVLQLVERFVYDLGLLIAGRAADLEIYVEAAVVGRLRSALEPALAAGTVTRPDFGEFAQVQIEGDLLDLSEVVQVVVEFDDRSTRSDVRGRVVARSRQRVRLRLLLDPAATRVLDHRLEIV